MIDHDNYIVPGDDIIAVPRSTNGACVLGRVLGIEGAVAGQREFIVELKGTHWLTDGAMGLPEALFSFDVCRGDAWVNVPLYLLPEEAAAKVQRACVNTRKRIQAKAPLFAGQIPVVEPSVHEMMARCNGSRHETLQRQHDAALRSNDLRDQVESLVTEAQFATLVVMRTRYPRQPLYGIEFWRDQLKHIHGTGQPRIFVAPPPISQSLNIPWIRPDAEVTWLSPDGDKQVRILFVGLTKVMIKILGDPFTAYDPKEYPYGNTWVQHDLLRKCE